MPSPIRTVTSSNGNIFRVTSPMCGEFTSSGEFPVTRGFDVFFHLRLNKWLSKQPRGWFLRRHRGHYDVNVMDCLCVVQGDRGRVYAILKGRSHALSYLTRDCWIIHHSPLPEYFSICYKNNLRNWNGNFPQWHSLFFHFKCLPPEMLHNSCTITKPLKFVYGSMGIEFVIVIIWTTKKWMIILVFIICFRIVCF